MSTEQFEGKRDELPIQELRLDPQNPRLPASIQQESQEALLHRIAEEYNAIEVARSIAVHGYFPSEPLIVIQQEDEVNVVVEGNRRLAALAILNEPDLANSLDDASDWTDLAAQADLPEEVPVVIAPNRQAVAPVIGYRHISGIEPWDPYAKARFIATLINEQNLEFNEVANLVGERPNEISAHYRNHEIVKQAKNDFNIDISRVTRRFGVFTRAMTSLDLRNHISAPAPSDVSPKTKPLPDDMKEQVHELLSWVFGEKGNASVISESRDITRLGKVLASEDGLRVLRQTRDLEAADVSAGGPFEKLKSHLEKAHNHLEAAREDIVMYSTDERVQKLLSDCKESLHLLVDQDG